MNKMTWWKYALIVLFAITINSVLILYFNKSGKKEKTGFVITQKLFEEFNGTKDLQKKIKLKEQQQKILLDSMALELKMYEAQPLLKKNAKYTEIRDRYELTYQQINQSNKQLLDQYNTELWKQINEYVKDYGKINNFDVIHGANGSGTLMYANESLDITESIIKYSNNKYAGE